jgi:hypothetical protein
MVTGQQVVDTARSVLGDAYQWGGEDNPGFDCSGLCQWVYAQNGVTIPRTSQEQAQAGTPVARADLQPGDLIIFYPDASHVALYSGNGNIIEAADYGIPIEEVPVDQGGPYNCARRYIADEPQEIPVTDTLFADVSEFQSPVDDSYPYRVLSIRSNDGTYQDHHFTQNYQWCVNAVESGKLEFFIVYYYWRPNETGVITHMNMVNAAGGPHPRMVSMIDLESGGNPGGDQSGAVNDEYQQLAAWLGNPLRVIGYANTGDFNNMWPNRPQGLRVIGAGYGQNPNLPGQIAHQYTDGTGYGGGLPEGCSPFGDCDMNSADGLDPTAFATACGLNNTPPPPTPGALMALTDQQQADLYNAIMGIAALVSDNNTQLRGPNQQGWKQLGQTAAGDDLTLVDAIASVKSTVEAIQTEGKPNG